MKCYLRIYIGGSEYAYRHFRSIRAAKRFVPKIVYKISCPASVDLYRDYAASPVRHWELQ